MVATAAHLTDHVIPGGAAREFDETRDRRRRRSFGDEE
jgi:hypothetical protein